MAEIGANVENGDVKIEEAPKEQTAKTEDTIKTESSRDVDSDDKVKKIVEQVEFYFGNINLPRDKFLQEEMKKEVGWVPLATMLKFNRLAKLSQDIDEIANALKISSLMEVSEDNAKIRRSQDHPLPDNTLEYWQKIKRRTVYVKGFTNETSLDDVMQFMNQFGVTDNISLRHTKTVPRVFKGSAFVTYATKEVAEDIVKKSDGKEFEGQPITVMMQETYWSNKAKERKEKKNAEKSIKQAKKAQTVEEQKQSLAATQFNKGLILKVSGYPPNTEMQILKDFFKKFGDVGFVAMSDNEAHIRFNSDSDNLAQKVWNKATKAGTDGKVIFNENELKGEILEGDEEQKYWDEFHKSKIAKSERINAKQNKFKKGKTLRNDGRGKKRPAGGKEEVSEDKRAKRIVFEDDDGEESEATTVKVDSTVEIAKNSEE